MHFRLQTPDHLGCHISSSEKKSKVRKSRLSLVSFRIWYLSAGTTNVSKTKERAAAV